MREILFRGKSIVADTSNTPGYWLEGSLVHNVLTFEGSSSTVSHIVTSEDQIDIWLDDNNEVWPETIGQYVGLKDADGKKIFEGDILESPVKRVGAKFGNLIVITDIRECKFAALYVNEYRIVGNIHDDPEILELRDSIVKNPTLPFLHIDEWSKKGN